MTKNTLSIATVALKYTVTSYNANTSVQGTPFFAIDTSTCKFFALESWTIDPMQILNNGHSINLALVFVAVYKFKY